MAQSPMQQHALNGTVNNGGGGAGGNQFPTTSLYVGDLQASVTDAQVYDLFSQIAPVVSVRVCRDVNTRRSLGYAYVNYSNPVDDASGQSKGYGFVQFDQEEAAQNAINKLNGMLVNDKPVFVGPFLRKQERENSLDKKFSNVFVKNLSESTTREDLEKVFGKYGKITSAVVMKKDDGKSRCFGFVNFENPDDAAQAVQELNGQEFGGEEWYVGRALKKSEREQELKEIFDQREKDTVDKYQGLNLYLKNLDASIGDDKLRELFSGFGYRYADRSLPGGTTKNRSSAVDFGRRRPIEGEIDVGD
ncbi:hypothetical protein BHE74_00051360 [Ensete ventricosum]|nr:hypothetical protein BHE74_00051360 [Ensete ventricosum]